jgi:hypothetical protein
MSTEKIEKLVSAFFRLLVFRSQLPNALFVMQMRLNLWWYSGHDMQKTAPFILFIVIVNFSVLLYVCFGKRKHLEYFMAAKEANVTTVVVVSVDPQRESLVH